MEDFPIVPPLLLEGNPKPRRLTTLNERVPISTKPSRRRSITQALTA